MADDKPPRPGDVDGRSEAGRLKSDLPMGEVVQSDLDERLGSLVRVLSGACQMIGAPQDRTAFVEELWRIVRPAAPSEQAADVGAQTQRIQELLDAFGRAMGRELSGDQRALLEQGAHALEQINATEGARRDLILVKNNVGLFLDNLAQVLGRSFDVNERRLLTRATVRFVGSSLQQRGPA